MSDRRPLRDDEMTALAEAMQFHALAALADAHRWERGDFVFHGGTSLYFVHGSPRRSEDLDFLMRRERVAEIGKVMERVRDYVNEAISASFGGSVELKSRAKGNKSVAEYKLGWSHPDRYRKVWVKAEFFPASVDDIRHYGHRLSPVQRPAGSVHIAPQIPAGTLDSILVDKIKALADRPDIKARDYFDAWWLVAQQKRARPGEDPARFCAQLDTNLAIYGLTRAEFCDKADSLLAFADCDAIEAHLAEHLPRFLPERMAQQLADHGLYREMAETSCALVQEARNVCASAPAADGEAGSDPDPEIMP